MIERKDYIMKWVRFQAPGVEAAYGILEGEIIHQIEGSMMGEYKKNGETFARKDVKLLVPCEPTKIFCIGANYVAHIKELGMEIPDRPSTFMKPITCAIANGENVVIPEEATRVDYEGELGIVIKNVVKRATPEEAKNSILGVTACNDVTERDLMKWPFQLTYGKSFDTFAPIGPFIDTEIDPDDTIVRTYLNGEKMQEDYTSKTVFKPSVLLSYLSQVITFYPGDIIMTGTPYNVQPMKDGDVVEIEIEGMGERLVNTVYDPKVHT